jgi:hypothetical protein
MITLEEALGQLLVYG